MTVWLRGRLLRAPWLALGPLVLGCSDPAGPSAGQVLPPLERDVLAIPTIADSPLEGELRILPPRGEPDWSYRVDIDDDGVWEASGPLRLGVSHFFRHEAIGLHGARVEFERAGGSFQIQKALVVNDPSYTQAGGSSERLESFTGIALSSDGEAVYATSHFHAWRLRATDLSVEWKLTLPTPGRLVFPSELFDSALALSRSGDVVFAAVLDSLYRIDLGETPIPRSLRAIEGRRHMEITPDGTLLLSNAGMIDRLDPQDGSVRATTGPQEIVTFAIFPNGTLVAALSQSGGRFVVYDVSTLIPVWELPLPENTRDLHAVGFAPAGDRAFVLLNSLDRVDLVVVSVTDREILAIHTLGPALLSYTGVSSPIVSAADGRHLAVGLRGSTYLVDLDRGIPIHFAESACCNYVAAEGNLMYVADHDDRQVKILHIPQGP